MANIRICWALVLICINFSSDNKPPNRSYTIIHCPATEHFHPLVIYIGYWRTYSSYGDKIFAASGPRLWNSLPVQLHNPDITCGLFRQQLKGHVFGNHGHGALWLLICSASEKHLLTYLLTYLLSDTHCTYLQRDDQAELTKVAVLTEINFPRWEFTHPSIKHLWHRATSLKWLLTSPLNQTTPCLQCWN